MAIITDTYRMFSNAPDHKFSSLLKEMKQRLNDPSISPADKITIANRIAAIESAGNERARNENLSLLIYSVYELGMSSLFGPVGAGIGTMTVSHHRREIMENKTQKIGKAKKIGGRRFGGKKSRGNTSRNLDKTSVVDGVSSYAMGVLWIAAMVPLYSVAGRTWSCCSSYLGY